MVQVDKGRTISRRCWHAMQTACSEEQIQQYFVRLRANVRSFIQRAHKRAWVGGATAPAAAHAAGQSRVSTAAVCAALLAPARTLAPSGRACRPINSGQRIWPLPPQALGAGARPITPPYGACSWGVRLDPCKCVPDRRNL